MTMSLRRSVTLAMAALLALSSIAPAMAGPNQTVRDQFDAISYSGNNGTALWVGSWQESPGDGPSAGEIRVVADPYCPSTNCLRFGPNNVSGRSVFRAVDLTDANRASLSFSFRRQLASGGDGALRARISSDGSSWNTLASYQLDTDDVGLIVQSIDISNWVGSPVNVGFFGSGDYGGYFFVDNVQVSFADNESPSFDSDLADRSDDEFVGVRITPQVTDPDDDDVSFAATGLPPGISIASETGVISGTIAFDAASSSPYRVVVTAFDSFGGLASESFVWSIADVNRTPTLAAIDDIAIDEGVAWQFGVDASDPDLPDNTLSYSLTNSPSGASIGPEGIISWTPAESSGPGTYAFTVEVKDSAVPPASVARSFSVSVDEVNVPPDVSPIAEQLMGVGDTVAIPVLAVDPDLPPNTLTFAATGLPSGVRINSTSGLISGTIPNDPPRTAGTAKVTVRDDGTPQAQAVKEFSWQVTTGNNAPVLDSVPDQNPEPGGTVAFAVTATDPDGDTLSFWVADGIDAVPDGATIDAATGEFVWSPSDAQHDATYRINVGVSDSGSPRLSDTQLVTIVVPKINKPPTVVSPSTQQSAEGESVSLSVAASDPDGDRLRFSAEGLPGGLTVNSATGVISGAVDYEAAAGSPHSVTVTATDNGKPIRSGSATFEWRIDNTNRPPTATDSEVTVVAGEPTSITLQAEDPDGDDLEYTIKIEPISGVLEGAGPEVTYTSEGGGADDSFTFVVSDGEFEAEAEVTVAFRVQNTEPTAGTDEYEVVAGEVLEVAAPGVLSNDRDPDDESLTATLVADPDRGQLVLNPDGSFTYTPDDGFVGSDKFTYAATDEVGAAGIGTVVLTVVAPQVATPSGVDDGGRVDVVTATSPAWEPPPSEGKGFFSSLPKALGAALNSSVATLPALRYPLLLLAIALLLAVTVGRIAYLPAAAMRRHERGQVKEYDPVHDLGKVAPERGMEAVFVHGKALEHIDQLTEGQEVEYVAAEVRGRRIALRVWPATAES